MSEFESAHEIHQVIDESHEGRNAAQVLADASAHSSDSIEECMHKGAVWHTKKGRTQRLRQAGKTLKIGEELHLYYNKQVLEEVPPEASLLADEHAYSVWHKPYGLYCQGSKWGDHCTINRCADTQLEPLRRASIIHRLDRAASGLILLGHEKKATRLLAQMFEQRKLSKTYRLIAHGHFDHFDQPLTIEHDIDGKAARSHARALSYDSRQDRSLVEINIETGRKHQIRRHMAESGYPLVGDRLHGRAKEDDENLQLAAYELAFVCPLTGEDRHYRLPEQFNLKL